MIVIEKRCAKCGKLFTVQKTYRFKTKKGYYCSWHCFKNSGYGAEEPKYESNIPREKKEIPFAPCAGLLAFRRERGMKAREVASIVGCNTSLILMIERGHRNASENFKRKFEKAFDLSFDETSRIFIQERA